MPYKMNNPSRATNDVSLNKTHYFPSKGTNGVDCWVGKPRSPNRILPESSSRKHKEKEFRISPVLARELGTEMSPNPKPRRPSGAIPSK